MHFLLLGATGRTGQRVVSELLSDGHTATALVRSPSSLAPHPGLSITTGSPLSKDDIHRALTATSPLLPTAAIITLNAPRASDSPFATSIAPPRFLADSCANACAVLAQAGISRVVVMSSAGVGDSWAHTPWLTRAFFSWTNVKSALEDHGMVDREIRTTGLEWTLVRAVRLRFDDEGVTEAGEGVRTLGSGGEGMGVMSSVGVGSVARFLVRVAVEGLFVREAVVVAN